MSIKAEYQAFPKEYKGCRTNPRKRHKMAKSLFRFSLFYSAVGIKDVAIESGDFWELGVLFLAKHNRRKHSFGRFFYFRK
jgi:hypothetical protein